MDLAFQVYLRFSFHEKEVELLKFIAFVDPSNILSKKNIYGMAAAFGMNSEVTDA